MEVFCLSWTVFLKSMNLLPIFKNRLDINTQIYGFSYEKKERKIDLTALLCILPFGKNQGLLRSGCTLIHGAALQPPLQLPAWP